MSSKHLTDVEIQELVFECVTFNETQERHIRGCSECLRKMESYKALSLSLNKLESPVMDFDVKNLVLSKIELDADESSKAYAYLIYSLYVLGLSVSIFAAILVGREFVNLQSPSTALIGYVILPIAIFVFMTSTHRVIKDYNKKMNCLDYSHA